MSIQIRKNVHDAFVSDCVVRSCNNLIKDNTHNVPADYADDLILDKDAKHHIKKWCTEDASSPVGINASYGQLFNIIWARINKFDNETRDEIKKIMNADIHASVGKCLPGRISRLINILSAYCDDIYIGISTNDQICNIITMTRRVLERENKYTVEDHRALAKKELEERGYAEETIQDYINCIE